MTMSLQVCVWAGSILWSFALIGPYPSDWLTPNDGDIHKDMKPLKMFMSLLDYRWALHYARVQMEAFLPQQILNMKIFHPQDSSPTTPFNQ